MTEIRSLQNPRLKALRKLHTKRGRAQSGHFLAEGEDLVATAKAAGRRAVEGYRASGTEIGGRGFLDVEAATLADVSSLGSGTRVIGVGAVIRSARAFGASCVALGPGCADPHSPKAVRASMGAIFAVELARAGEPGDLPGRLIALSADAREALRGPLAAAGGEVTLLVGAEREGLPADVVAACESHARIPIAGDSLNAAMAATVALYEMTRDEGAPVGNRSSRVPAS